MLYVAIPPVKSGVLLASFVRRLVTLFLSTSQQQK
jgi:hypothetical protein